jgi:hypothetical protein
VTKKPPKGADDFLREHGATRANVDGARRDDFDPPGDPKQTLKLRQVAALLAPFLVGVDPVVVDTQLRRIVELLAKADRLTIESARNMAITAAKAAKIPRPVQLVDTAFSVFTAEREGAEEDAVLAVRLLDPEPDPSAGGGDVLAEVIAVLRKYVVMPIGADILIAFWALHTYLLTSERLDVSPILSIVSPVRRCGKTTLLSLLTSLVQRGLPVSNITPAAVFRVIEKFHPVLLVDECDAFMQSSDKLRGLVNSGHTRTTAFVLRVEGDDRQVKVFSTWGAKALALIGSPAATIEDRSILIRLKRRTKTEKVTRLRAGTLHAELEPIRRALAWWARDRWSAFEAADPELPEFLHDRQADNLRPLYQLAQAAGGPWPARMLEATEQVYRAGSAGSGEDVQLLADVRDLLADPLTLTRIVKHNSRGEAVCIPPGDLHRELLLLEDAQWKTYDKGYPVSLHKLGRLLGDFGIQSRLTRFGDDVMRGYSLVALKEAFKRYLVAPEEEEGGQEAANQASDPLHPLHPNDSEGLGRKTESVTNPSVTDSENDASARKERVVTDVTDSGPSGEGQRESVRF